MINVTWSPELSTTIASLKKMDLSERMTALKNLTGFSQQEKQAIVRGFSKSEKNEPKEDFWY